MDRVFLYDVDNPPAIRFAAVAIKEVAAGRRHTGLLYSNEGGVVRFLHLAWHLDLRSDSPKAGYAWVDPLVNPRRLRQVASVCRLVWRANGRHVPYAFSPPSDCFSAATGEWLLGPTRHGLTCATFVLAMFELAGLRLIDLSDWPERSEDRTFQEWVVELLKERGATPPHIRAVQDETGAARVRPEEVAASAAVAQRPASFADLWDLSLQIVRFLHRGERSED